MGGMTDEQNEETKRRHDEERSVEIDGESAFAILRKAEPRCPKCGRDGPYFLANRRVHKCRKCGAQFSATSGTIFAGHKMSVPQVITAWRLLAAGMGGTALAKSLGITVASGGRLIAKYRANGGRLELRKE